MKNLKEKIMNSTIEEVGKIFTELKQQGYTLKDIERIIKL